MESCSGSNIVKFSKGKCRGHLGTNSPIYQHRLGGDLLESSSVEKKIGVLVGKG